MAATVYAKSEEIMQAILEGKLIDLSEKKQVSYATLKKAYGFMIQMNKSYKSEEANSLIKRMEAEGKDKSGVRGKQPVQKGDVADFKVLRITTKSGKAMGPRLSIPVHTLVGDADVFITAKFEENKIILTRKANK